MSPFYAMIRIINTNNRVIIKYMQPEYELGVTGPTEDKRYIIHIFHAKLMIPVTQSFLTFKNHGVAIAS